MKYYYNKAQPNIEYGMLSSRSLNNPKRKPNPDKKEHNNNHKHDRRYLDVEKYYRKRREIDEDDRETNAWEYVADKKTLNFENDIIEELDKNALLSTLSQSDRIIFKLYEACFGQKHIAKAIGKTQSYVSKHLERL